jgi:hypothetical protein
LNNKQKKGESKVLEKKRKTGKENWIMRAELKNGRDLRKVCEGESGG